MYFHSPLAWYRSNEELNTIKSEKITSFKIKTAKIFYKALFYCVWNPSCYDSLKIKYAKLQTELSFACAQRPFYSHSSKTSFWILLPTPGRGKPANNSKYNMRRQMLQKSVWQEATMLRSAEVGALFNQTILVPLTVWSKMQSEETIQVPVNSITDALWCWLYQWEQSYPYSPPQAERWAISN